MSHINCEPDPRDAEIARLRERVRELEKDAARYRWLRAQHWTTEAICVVTSPRDNTKLGAWCPSRDMLNEAIDMTMEAGK